MSLEEHPDLSPKHLMLQYVKLTSLLVPEGSLLLRQLFPPFSPLSANTIGSITRKMLQQFGIATKLWGPHSTRGAGVKFYKKLGLTSEEVCEIGKWKNTSAFNTHYLRIGASASASKKLSAFLVHNVSCGQSAEPEWSRSPGNKNDTGRSDHEGEAQRPHEPEWSEWPVGLRLEPYGKRCLHKIHF